MDVIKLAAEKIHTQAPGINPASSHQLLLLLSRFSHVRLLDYPGNSVYVVKGQYEYMIPAVSHFILSTDMEANRMEVRLIEGMRSDEN